MNRPLLLFISPVIPATSRSGRHIRACAFVREYCRDYRVIFVTPDHTPVEDRVAGMIHQLVIVEKQACPRNFTARLLGWLPPAARFRLMPLAGTSDDFFCYGPDRAAGLHDMNFGRIHVFRLYMMPVLFRLFPARRLRQFDVTLDIDDIESLTYARMAKLAGERKMDPCRRYYAAMATVYAAIERRWLRIPGEIHVCSSLDRTRLLEAHDSLNITVRQNRYLSVDCRPASDERRSARTLLFVGSMGYFPNQDAVQYFLDEVLPVLRNIHHSEFHLYIAGDGMPEELARAVLEIPETSYLGYVENITEVYRQADLLVCPLRAGGGTRVKILEAVAHRTPVITTTAGLEGLEFTEDEVCVADNPADFAQHIDRVLNDTAATRAQVERAYNRFKSRYELRL